MKKLAFSIIFLAVMAVATPLFAQSLPENNTIYINVSLERVFQTRYGYVVSYWAGNNRLARAAIPLEWLEDAAGKAEIIRLPRGTSWPSLSVFFRDGEFSHARLYVHPSRRHPTWGSLNPSPELTQMFQDAETITLEF